MKKVMILLLSMLILVFTGSVSAAEQGESDLGKAWEIIQNKQFVDLTHTFGPGIPHFFNVYVS